MSATAKEMESQASSIENKLAIERDIDHFNPIDAERYHFYECIRLYIKKLNAKDAKSEFVINLAFRMLDKTIIPAARKQIFEDLKAFSKSSHPNHKDAYILLGLSFDSEFGTFENSLAAFHYYELAAKEQCLFGITLTGACYYMEYGVKKNKEKGFQLLSFAAEQDFELSFLYLREIIYGADPDDLEDQEDLAKALRIIQEDSLQGLKNAQFELALLYLVGIGLAEDKEEAVKLLALAAEKGDAKAKAYYAACLSNGVIVKKDLERALILFKEAASEKNRRALHQLGDIYNGRNGEDWNSIVKVDHKMAFEYYTQALEQGEETVLYSLGLRYETGMGVDKNLAKAIEYYQRGADLKVVNCQFALGQCYEYGLGVPKDKEMAIKWYELAAEQGNTRCHYRIGILLFDSEKKNHADNLRALKHCKLSALANDVESQGMLGLFYGYSVGVYRDAERATLLFQNILSSKSANQKCLEVCQNYLDDIYASLPELPKTIAELVDFIREEAKKGEKSAFQVWAFCNHYGLGVPQDLQIAIEFYKHAIERGLHICLWDLLDGYLHLPKKDRDFKELLEYLTDLLTRHPDADVKIEAMKVLSHIYYEGLLGEAQNLQKALHIFEKNWHLIDKKGMAECLTTPGPISCFHLAPSPSAQDIIGEERLRTLSFLPTYHQFLNSLPHFNGVKDISGLVAEYAVEVPPVLPPASSSDSSDKKPCDSSKPG